MVGVWEIDANGYIATLSISGDNGNYSGTIQFDIVGTIEPLSNVIVRNGEVSFTRGGQQFSGFFGATFALGTFADGGAIEYAWEARRTSSRYGLVELGDFNGDGNVDNEDIVGLLRGFDITPATYRVADDVFNPGCFGLLEN